jgi:hypothetical protein
MVLIWVSPGIPPALMCKIVDFLSRSHAENSQQIFGDGLPFSLDMVCTVRQLVTE